MKVLKIKDKSKRVERVRKLMLSVGNRIGVVHFIKRSDGKKRRMSYRVHVRKPQYASIPNGKSKNRNEINKAKDLLTVFDTNVMRYNQKGRICGRGDWRSVSLDSVTRLSLNGEIYKVMA